MQGFYRSAAMVRRINDRLLQRFEEQFDGERGAGTGQRGLRAAPRLPGRHATPAGRSATSRRCSRCSPLGRATRDVRGLHSQTARALAEALPRSAGLHRGQRRALRAQFMALLRGPQRGRHAGAHGAPGRAGALAAGVRAGVRAHAVRPVPCLHRRPAHADGAAEHRPRLRRRRADERFSIAHEVWPRLRKPELLLLAGLFHDIAKGRGGDHSELGAVDAREFARRMALSEADTDLVAWLVRTAPADVGDRAEAGHLRSGGDPPLRHARSPTASASTTCTC